MGSKLKVALKNLFDVEPHERLKLLFLSLSFFFIIGSYTLVKELKDAIFVSIVGREYVPIASGLSMIVLIPAILIYSSLVDRIRRYQLMALYSAVFGCLGLVIAYFLGDPRIGLANTDAHQFRLFGWFVYFYGEGFSPFVVSVFWAFANSINSPEAAKRNYAFLTSASKIGGMMTASLGWFLLGLKNNSGALYFSDVMSHQLLVAFSACLLLCVPIFIVLLMKKVSGRYLHGYEAVYRVEKEQVKTGQDKTGVFAGLSMLLSYPYVLGIFGMVFFYEVVTKVLSLSRLSIAQSHATSISGVSSFLFKITFMMHAFGFVLSFFGTRTLLQVLGERICILLIPLGTGLLLLYFIISYNPDALLAAFIGTKVINYAFSWPVRESLYIPTTKEIKFKSKSWIDAFGSKFAKTTGSIFNYWTLHISEGFFLPALSFFFAGVIGLWFLTAFSLGRRFDKAVQNNEVIGL
jgi:ATP:ADP antiporter, AAA family